MAISSQTTTVSYTGNASLVTPYPVTFRYDEAAWVTVQEIDEDGAVTTLALGSDYTLTGNGSTTTGNVVTGGGAIPATSTLRISRDTALTQAVSLTYAGAIPSAVLEAEFDKLTMAQLDQKRRQAAGDARSLRVPDGELAAELPAATVRKGEVIYFNATTGAVETKTPLELFVLADSEIAADAAAAEAAAAAAQAAETAAETAQAAAEAAADEAAAAIGIVHNVKNFGAVGNAKATELADMTSGSAVLSTSGYSGFTVGDVGKRIIVYGAGAAGVPLETTIAAYTSATQVTLSATASTTVANSAAVWGTDDTSAFAAAITAAKASALTRTIYVPVGQYLANVVLNEPNLQLVGTSSRQGFYQPADATNNQAGTLGSVIFAADPDEPVISMPTAGTGNAYGTQIRNLQLCGFLKTGFGIEIGDREFTASGYPGHSWALDNLNMVGFKYALVIASAGSATVTNCQAAECEFGFHVAEVPFASSNGISDNVVFTSCVTTYTDYPFVVAASKNTVIQSGDYNYPITWATIVNNGTLNVIGANVENASTSVVDIQTGGKLLAQHIQVLGDFKIRNYSTSGSEQVNVMSSSVTPVYMTSGLEFPEKLAASGTVMRYTDTTFGTLRSTEFLLRAGEGRDMHKAYEPFYKTNASPYGSLGWILTNIAGTTAVTGQSKAISLYQDAANEYARFQPETVQFNFATNWRMVWKFNCGGGQATTVFRMGLYSQDGTAAMIPTNGIGLRADTVTEGDTTLKLEVIVGGVKQTAINTGLALTALNTRRELILEKRGANVYLTIKETHGTFVANQIVYSGTMPSSSAAAGPAVFVGGSAAQLWYLCRMSLEELP